MPKKNIIGFPWREMLERGSHSQNVDVLQHFRKVQDRYEILSSCPAEIRTEMIRRGMSGPLSALQMLELIEYFRETQDPPLNIISMEKTNKQ